jgi:hypothetical protein
MSRKSGIFTNKKLPNPKGGLDCTTRTFELIKQSSGRISFIRLFGLISAVFMELSVSAAFAGMAEINSFISAISGAKTAIRNAVNVHRPGFLTAGHSFATYPDAIAKVCGGTLTAAPNPGNLNISDALLSINSTKQGMKSALGSMGVSITDSTSITQYAKKVESIGCAGELGYFTATGNGWYPYSTTVRCGNQVVCDVVSGATGTCQNNIFLGTLNVVEACIGKPDKTAWTLVLSCNSNCNTSTNIFTAGNIYRMDMRNATGVKSLLFVAAYDTRLYSFQTSCNGVAGRLCIGMLPTPENDYNIGNTWSVQDLGAGNAIMVPNITVADITAVQPSLSLRVYKLGS